jgi:hypothetical protein
VSAANLISVFRHNGISLHLAKRCVPPNLVDANNMSNNPGPADERIHEREGDVLCSIQASTVGHIVRRVRYPGDQETYLDTLTVDCSVYPSDDQHANVQIARVERALHDLLRRFGGTGGPTSLRVADLLIRELRTTLGVNVAVEQPSNAPTGFPVALKPSTRSRAEFGQFEVLIYDLAREPKLQVEGVRPDTRGVYWTPPRGQSGATY